MGYDGYSDTALSSGQPRVKRAAIVCTLIPVFSAHADMQRVWP